MTRSTPCSPRTRSLPPSSGPGNRSGPTPFGPTPGTAIDAPARADGVLTRAGRGPGAGYLFLHRTLQEYLLARALGLRDDWLNHLRHHLYDPAWREPLAMLGGVWDQLDREQGKEGSYRARTETCVAWLMRENARDLCHRPFLLAGRIMVEGRRCLPERMARGLTNGLVDLVTKPPVFIVPRVVDEARQILGVAGPEVVEPLNMSPLRSSVTDSYTQAALSTGTSPTPASRRR